MYEQKTGRRDTKYYLQEMAQPWQTRDLSSSGCLCKPGMSRANHGLGRLWSPIIPDELLMDSGGKTVIGIYQAVIVPNSWPHSPG